MTEGSRRTKKIEGRNTEEWKRIEKSYRKGQERVT
jgi:hypothetical protein